MTGIERLHEIMTRLRDPQAGCPWDRIQTLESLKPCVLEETYELLAAMDKPDDQVNYVEELGDVLLQIMVQSVMAEKEGRFTFDDVANGVSDKLVHRHPHVFGDVKADDPATVLRNWEQLKQLEHKKESRHSALDGVPPTLPGLLKAQRTQEKAARVGFDWKDPSRRSRKSSLNWRPKSLRARARILPIPIASSRSSATSSSPSPISRVTSRSMPNRPWNSPPRSSPAVSARLKPPRRPQASRSRK